MSIPDVRTGVPPVSARGPRAGAITALAVLCAVLAGAAVLAATRLGIGATPDTGHYLATADNVLQGRGYVRLGPETMASWPPLYPTLLAGFRLVGLDMLTGARLLNALLLALCAAAAVFWVARRTRALPWAAAAGLAVALSPPVVYSASLAVTDAPFACLVLLALWRLDVWLDTPRPATLAGSVALMAAAALLRYNGVVLIATAMLTIVALAPLPFWRRITAAAIAGAAAALPLALWFARNLLVTGTLAGPRVGSEYGVLEAGADAGYTVLSWLVPYRVLLTSRWTGLALLVLLLGALAAAAWRLKGQALGRTAATNVLFVTCFLGFMIFTFTQVSIDPLADRMLAPVYIPLVVASIATAAALFAGAPARLRMPVTAVGGLAVLLVLAVVGSRTAASVRESWAEGPGGAAHSNFNTDAWRASPTLQWAGQHLRNDMVFASAPAALYIATGANSRPMPRKHARRSPGVPHDRLPDLREQVARAGGAYLVVVEEHVPNHTFTLDELAAEFVIERVHAAADGAIYRLTPRGR